MAAARHADVVATDPNPLVIGRGGEHAAQQLAIARLGPGLLGQLAAHRRDPVGERVADALELTEIEDTRL